MSEPNEEYRPRCQNLSCKSLLVYGEAFEQGPDYQDGLEEMWCLCTSKGQGPDGDNVSLAECSDPQRGCYREY
jgi:hypothetical protein